MLLLYYSSCSPLPEFDSVLLLLLPLLPLQRFHASACCCCR
jgi:hypothetical protein